MKIVFVVLVLAIFACNGAVDDKAKSSTVKNDSSGNGKYATNNEPSNEGSSKDSVSNDSTLLISFPRDSTWVTVKGKIKGINQPVTAYIPVKQGKQLSATIVPEDSVANIRINQIFTPDGKADGPFGRELKRTLHQQGTYKLIVGENMMQGDEWKGNFKLTVRVE